MKNIFGVFVLINLTILYCGFGFEDDPKKIIEENNKKYSEGFKQKDASIILNLYADDIVFGPPQEDFVKGINAVKEFWVGGIEFGITDMEITIMEVRGDDDIFYETGKIKTSILAEDGVTTEFYDKYVKVWEKQEDGSFKISVEMWNEDAAAEED